jgi:tRNA dimethylallyltransferase
VPPSLPKIIVVAGPTASGKSALALAVAEEFNAVVINADSQQCYRDLPLLTARPTPEEEARAPHRLFGTLGPTGKDSGPAWARRAAQEIAANADRVSILVGGSGLYLQSLMVGLPEMPEIAPEFRAAAKALLSEIGHDAFHARLAQRDPTLAARLKVGDTQRILRAWEVAEATGRPLSAWQADPPRPIVAAKFFPVLILPPRAAIIAAGDTRFDRMMAAGALGQVRDLLTTGIGPTAPVMRALGARSLAAHLAGEIALEEAVDLGKIATRQYAKRQSTWFRHQFPAALTISEQFSERLLPEIFAKIRDWG